MTSQESAFYDTRHFTLWCLKNFKTMTSHISIIYDISRIFILWRHKNLYFMTSQVSKMVLAVKDEKLVSELSYSQFKKDVSNVFSSFFTRERISVQTFF